MTTDQLIIKAEKWLKEETGGNCRNLSAKQVAKAMVYYHQHLLKQTACYTTLELLEQKLKEATEAVVPSDDEVGLMEKDSEIAYLNQVIEYIKDLQANVV